MLSCDRLLFNYIYEVFRNPDILQFSGENALHMAISNEDPATCKYLMDQGIDVSQRCFGNFFTPEDQKNTRSHTLDYEWVDMRLETNYEG